MKNIFHRFSSASLTTSIMLLSISLFFYTFPNFSYRVVSDIVQVDMTKQVECLTKNIYYEAANQSFEGKLAVAQVTVNRTNAPGFPSDICGVVYQRTINNGVTVCQFSWTCENTNRPRNPYLWEEARYIAIKVLTSPLEHDKIKAEKVLYYHADYVNPGWNKNQIVAHIGNHIFYRKI